VIHSVDGKQIRVMLTAFRDGLQSVFGGKVRTVDILPALKVAVAAGIRHFEFGGGARYQAPYFYVGEDPFEAMDRMREAAGEGVELQILTRSVSGVTLNTQARPALALQAKLMRKHGTTIDRNFDFMNDVDNLVATAQPIIEAGMHHQLCVAMMGLPYESDTTHTAAYYVDVVQRVLERGVRVDSVCMKDASGTTDPRTCFETARGIKRLLPDDVPLWQHTHDTASMAVACYLAGIEGGVDGIDLSVRPLASGTSQPDVRSMWHALKGTGFTLDVDHTAMNDIEVALNDGLADYAFNPITLAADARVVDFPMPGGAIGPNVHMMAKAGILDRYGDVLSEFPVVVEAGGAWTSVTPGSQQYWLQAFNNVLHGRWQKIDAGYGRSVLGYFGRPPETPDPEVVKAASEQLGLEPFEGDPLAAASDSLAPARAALAEHGLPATDENVFLVASAIVPGKRMELNEGLRLLTGKARIDLPLKAAAAAPPAAAAAANTAGARAPAATAASGPPTERAGATPPAAPATAPAAAASGPLTTIATVVEGNSKRVFRITLEPMQGAGSPPGAAAVPPVAAVPASSVPESSSPAPAARGEGAAGESVDIASPFGGTVEVLEIKVAVGDRVEAGQIVAAVEAMKAEHEVRSSAAGTVTTVHVSPGDEVGARQPIISLRR
jgi:pyruvate carboxylase subunit B